jgi:hypothetical protein
MAVTNGYTTLANVKGRLRISTTDTADDAVLETFIDQASRLIDRIANRTFYARTETHTYDVPWGRELMLMDDDLLTITTLSNGDGVAIANTEYKLLPRNITPKYAIVLNESSLVVWEEDVNGNNEGVISIVGTWGYSATTPDDIRGACEEIVTGYYKHRFGVNTEGAAIVTGAGVVITPEDVSKDSMRVLRYYQRLI